MAALFLSVAVGCWIGKIRIGNFSLGGMAGAITESACIGTAGEALPRLGLGAEKLKALQANIGVTCAIT